MQRSLHILGALGLAFGMTVGEARAQVCEGNCGTLGPDGVVTAPPAGGPVYRWVSTDNGINGVGLPGIGAPPGGGGAPTDGSRFTTSMFSAAAGDNLEFYFNYVTSDGAGFADYAWARLLHSDKSEAALLFTARTVTSGSMVPGAGMPAPAATLTPASATVKPGTVWSPLGGDSGDCWDTGCGHSGWVFSQYAIGTAGNYFLEFGVTNWDDTLFDSGLAWSGTQVGGTPVDPVPTVPEPATVILLGTGLLGVGIVARRRRGSADGEE